jgi:hypothetical protein
MRILFQIVISGSLFFYSCSQSSKENTVETNKATSNVNPATVVATQPAATKTVDQPVQSSSAVALNPAHGMPGHRCDIQVGQPLNSAPAPQNIVTAPTQTATQSDMGPIRTNPAPSQLPAPAVAQRINPAHGQPGHSCSVAVGAPLPN